MALQIQLATDFNANTIGYGKFSKNKSGGKSIYINNGMTPSGKLYLQLPPMRAPFGVSSFTDENSGKVSYSLDLAYDDGDEAIANFRKKMEQLDDMVVNMVAENSLEWLGKKSAAAGLKEFLYKPLVRFGKKEGYAPSLKCKIMQSSSGEFSAEAYNMKREQVPLDSIEKGQRITAIIEFNQIWITPAGFGVGVRLQQCMLEASKKLPKFAFVGLPEPTAGDEEEKGETTEEEEEEESYD